MMKISPPINAVVAEVEAWALRDGWKTVVMAITEHYHASGGGDILPTTDTEKGMDNAMQRVKRIFRGYDGPKYAPQAEGLKAAALAALPTGRRAMLTEPKSVNYLTSRALQDVTTAVTALMLGCSEVTQKISRAVDSMQALLPIAQSLTA